MTCLRCWLAGCVSFVVLVCLSRAQDQLDADCSVFLKDGSNIFVDSSLFNQSAGPFLPYQTLNEKASTDAIRLGNNTIVVCLFEKVNDLTVSWFNNDSKVLINSTKCPDGENGVYSIIGNVTADGRYNATLVICKAKQTDAASYILRMTSPFNRKKTVQIFSEAYVVNKKDFKSKSVYEGNSITLVCEVTGVPPPEVYWFFDDAPLSNGSHSGRINIFSSSSTIRNLSLLELSDAKSSDRGHYKCFVNNTRDDGTAIMSNYTSLLLRVRDPLGALWPFLGMVAQAVILAIIIYADDKVRPRKPSGFERLGSGRGSSIRSMQSDYGDGPAVSVMPDSGTAQFSKQHDRNSDHAGAEPLMNEKEAVENINLHSVSV